MTNCTIGLRWKIITSWPAGLPPIFDNITLNCSPSVGFFHTFGSPPDLAYVPFSLTPTVVFHQTLRNLIYKQLGVAVREPKFPYTLSLPGISQAVTLSLNLHLFLPNILAITVDISPFDALFDPGKIIDYQSLDKTRVISKIIRWTAQTVKTCDHKMMDAEVPPVTLSTYPFVRVIMPTHFGQLDLVSGDKLREYTGIVIRNPAYSLMDQIIPERMVDKNREHNVKSPNTIVLIDKMGALHVTAGYRPNDFLSPRQSRVSDLVEIALVAKEFIKQYRRLRRRDEDLADFYLQKVTGLVKRPDVVFSKSVTNRYLWDLLSKEFVLKDSLDDAIKYLDQDALAKKSRYFDRFDDSWWTIKDFAAVLSSSIAEAQEEQVKAVGDVSRPVTLPQIQLDSVDDDRRFATMAIEEARKSVSEDERPHPKVGAVVVKNGELLGRAHRGENPKSHAEYIALEDKLSDDLVAGATVYTTLEPCTTRNHPKIPCAQRLIDRKVRRVVIGMLDPNPDIRGLGDQLLGEAGIEVQLFPRDLRAQVEEMNREFIRAQKQKLPSQKAKGSTDDLAMLAARSLADATWELQQAAWSFYSLHTQYGVARAARDMANDEREILQKLAAALKVFTRDYDLARDLADVAKHELSNINIALVNLKAFLVNGQRADSEIAATQIQDACQRIRAAAKPYAYRSLAKE